MLLKVQDALGVQQTIISKGQESIADRSGSITTTATSQLLLEANPLRSGIFFQNNSIRPMWLNELGAAVVAAGSIQISAGAILSADYPVTGNAWQVLGTAGDFFTAREW